MNHKKSNGNKNILKENNMTYDDYATLDDGNRYELVKGQLQLISPSPPTIHQLLNAEIYKKIESSCTADYFILYAPIDVILSSREVRQPDLILVSRKRIDILTSRGIEGVPDLVIEILSPSSLKLDKIDKLKAYAHFKIPEYWIVDPKLGVLEQYALSNERYDMINIFQEDEQITSSNIACVSFTMKEVMENIPQLEE